MSHERKTVLIIEDEPDTRDYLTCLLSDRGFRVRSAANGEEGLAALETVRPDLVTLDITMPQKTGIAVYRVMRKHSRWKKIPIIIITGIAKEFEHFISTRRTVPPPDGYVNKPIDQQKLLGLVEGLFIDGDARRS